MEGLNNIYQKGALVTCRHCPIAELWSSRVFRWQLGAHEEAPAVILQTEFLRAASATLSVGIKDNGFYHYTPKKKKQNEITREVCVEGE